MIDLSSVQTLVVDEADTMLDMGFLKDIEMIFEQASPKRQVMMFSATLSQNVRKLAKEFLSNPLAIEIHAKRSNVGLIKHEIYNVDALKKTQMLSFLIGSKNYSQVLIFVNTKKRADHLAEQLTLDGLPAEAIHGDIKQPARARALKKFKKNEIRILVATDIAARGIDIEQLPQLVNFELPETIDDFTHRVGRTGRAGHQGHAITLLCVKEYRQMLEIEKELKLDIERKTHEDYEPTEKVPRIAKFKKSSLSEKKGLNKTFRKKKQDKHQLPTKGAKKSKKTTKRDENRKFGK